MTVGLALDNFAALLLRIGDGNELTVLVLKEAVQDLAPSWPQPNASHGNPIARRYVSITTKRAGRNNGGHADSGNRSSFKKGTTGRFSIHRVFLFKTFGVILING
jgi:hypothetical protein